MAEIQDNPRIYIPPPLIYAGMFLLSIVLQRYVPIEKGFFASPASHAVGTLAIALGLAFNIPALRQFAKTKNTVITVKPANSLQTTGIYSRSRNPMYLSLLLLYLGLAFWAGNWWTLILFPLLVAVVTLYIIRREERYLERAFGKAYLDYKHKVRRWI